MFLVRWLPTFLAFPVGGYVSIQVVDSMEGPLTAALGGLIVGLFVGIAQWLVLRGRGMGPAWAAYTVVGAAVGLAAASAVTDSATSIGALVVMGLIAGAVLGGAQARLLHGTAHRVLWTLAVSASWGAGWLVTGNVIVDAERGFYSFGASGALLVTVVTGLVLPRLLGAHDSAQPITSAAPLAVSSR